MSVNDLVVQAGVEVWIPINPIPMPESLVHPQRIDTLQAGQIDPAKGRPVADDDQLLGHGRYAARWSSSELAAISRTSQCSPMRESISKSTYRSTSGREGFL